MSLVKQIFFVSLSLVVANSSEVQVSKRCDFLDFECKKMVLQHLLKENLLSGNISMNIPQIEPMELKQEVFTLPNALKFTLENGTAKGLKNCVYDKLQSVLEEPFHTRLEIICNIEIKGESIIEVPKSVIKEIGGEDSGMDVINAKGKIKVAMEGMHLCLNIPFSFEWRNNDIYLVGKRAEICNIVLHSSTLFIEDLDVHNKINNEKIRDYLKDKTEELNITSLVTNRTLIFFQAFVDNYLAKIPAKDIYTTDLTNF